MACKICLRDKGRCKCPPALPSSSLNCLDCGACCKVVMIPIEGIGEDEINWLNMHEGLMVQDGKLIIRSRCKNLLPDNKCAIYWKRPMVCSDFPIGGESCLSSRKLLQVQTKSENKAKQTDLDSYQQT